MPDPRTLRPSSEEGLQRAPAWEMCTGQRKRSGANTSLTWGHPGAGSPELGIFPGSTWPPSPEPSSRDQHTRPKQATWPGMSLERDWGGGGGGGGGSAPPAWPAPLL